MKKLFLAFIAMFVAFTASAQIDKDVIDIDEVVVASFYSPSVTATDTITSEEIAFSNYGQDPANYFVKTPSVIALNDNGTEFGYGYFRIRGLDQTRINVTLDGCPWNEAEDFGSYFANSPDLMSSLESINLGKGASTSYNGVAGIAGGVALESINIYKENDSYAYIGGGSFGGLKTTAVYNMSPTNGWGLHVKATHQQTDGYRDNSSNKSQAITAKTGYKFNNDATIDFLTVSGFHRNGQGWIGNTLEELAINPNANGNTAAEDDNWFMTMNRLQYKQRFGNTIFTASAYYQFQAGSYRFDLDNYMTKMVGENLNSGAIYDYGLTHNMYGANVAAKTYLNSLTFTYGINAYSYNRKHYMGDKTVNVDLVTEDYNNTGYKNDISGYLMIDYKPINNLSLSGNVQYRHADFRYTDHLNSDMSFNAKDNNTNWDFCNFGFNVEYLPIRGLKTYARFNHINREPTRSDMFGGNESYIGELNTIVPEVVNDLEVGIAYNSDKITASLNGYYMWFNNELVLTGEYGLNGLPCHTNVIDSFRRGIEAEFDWNFVDNFNVRFATALSQNKLKTELYGIKNHILSPSFTFDGDIYYTNNKATIGLNTNYRSEVYIDITNEYKVPELFTVNAYFEYNVNDSFTIGGKVNNITNRVNYNNAVLGANNQVLYFRNASTNFNLYLKYNF
jgi:iron complex outermembrane receptor protein